MSMALTKPTIAICVATFRRPNGLARLLESLLSLEISDFQPHLIIADNDPEATGQSIAEDFRNRLPFPVTYVVEPTRGISSVRNRLVKEADALGAEFIAYVDDDETVDPFWLTELLRVMQDTNASVVGGPVISLFDGDVPMYLQKCFGHRVAPTGKPVKRIGTGSVLFRSDMLTQISGPFNVNLNLSGGADSLLSEEILQMGGTLLWSADALAWEYVPASRLSIKWVLRRRFRGGAGESRITKLVHPGRHNLVKNLYHGIGAMGLGTLRFVRALIVDRDMWLHWLGMVSFGMGEFLGVFTTRATLSEYRNITGN